MVIHLGQGWSNDQTEIQFGHQFGQMTKLIDQAILLFNSNSYSQIGQVGHPGHVYVTLQEKLYIFAPRMPLEMTKLSLLICSKTICARVKVFFLMPIFIAFSAI